METKTVEKWIVERLPHIDAIDFSKGTALFPTKKEAEAHVENLARVMADARENPSERDMQFAITRKSYRVRKVKVIEIR